MHLPKTKRMKINVICTVYSKYDAHFTIIRTNDVIFSDIFKSSIHLTFRLNKKIHTLCNDMDLNLW